MFKLKPVRSPSEADHMIASGNPGKSALFWNAFNLDQERFVHILVQNDGVADGYLHRSGL